MHGTAFGITTIHLQMVHFPLNVCLPRGYSDGKGPTPRVNETSCAE